MAGFIDTKCSNCGGKMELSPDGDMWVCERCGSTFAMQNETVVNNIVTNTTNNTKINIENVTIDDGFDADALISRACDLAYNGEYGKAVAYAQAVLDRDPNHTGAKKILTMQFKILGKYIPYNVVFQIDELIINTTGYTDDPKYIRSCELLSRATGVKSPNRIGRVLSLWMTNGLAAVQTVFREKYTKKEKKKFLLRTLGSIVALGLIALLVVVITT